MIRQSRKRNKARAALARALRALRLHSERMHHPHARLRLSRHRARTRRRATRPREQRETRIAAVAHVRNSPVQKRALRQVARRAEHLHHRVPRRIVRRIAAVAHLRVVPRLTAHHLERGFSRLKTVGIPLPTSTR